MLISVCIIKAVPNPNYERAGVYQRSRIPKCLWVVLVPFVLMQSHRKFQKEELLFEEEESLTTNHSFFTFFYNKPTSEPSTSDILGGSPPKPTALISSLIFKHIPPTRKKSTLIFQEILYVSVSW